MSILLDFFFFEIGKFPLKWDLWLESGKVKVFWIFAQIMLLKGAELMLHLCLSDLYGEEETTGFVAKIPSWQNFCFED